MNLTLVAAVAVNGIMGPISWRLPSDLKRFKARTMGKYVIVGRKTAETLPELRGRVVLVATGNNLWRLVTEALTQSHVQGRGEVIVGGGAQIYEQLWPHVTKAIITRIDADLDGDIYFPPCPDPGAWVWKDRPLDRVEGDEYHTTLSVGIKVD